MRDEITRRSLENPDIYVFVLSALQPLSAADIAMMRLLNGLHKDRIIVFINRVDQLANPVVDATVVKRAVKKRLRLEFPNLHIPVIIGSAWLGGLERPATPSLRGRIASSFGPSVSADRRSRRWPDTLRRRSRPAWPRSPMPLRT